MTDPPGRLPDPLERHRRQTDAVLAGGDPAAIKGLYRELGQDLWDQAAAGPVEAIPVLSAPETRQAVLDALGGVTGLVLDAGCGPNPPVAIELSRRPATTVVALDIGWGMVRTAVFVAATEGCALAGVVGDVERLPFRDGAFDALVCDDTVEHLPDDRAGVAELGRVVRSGGRAVLATPNRHSAAVLAVRLRDRLSGARRPARDYYVASSHLREYTWGEFERLVAGAFVIEQRHLVGWREGWKKRLLTRVLAVPGLYRVSQMVVVEARAGGAGPGAGGAAGVWAKLLIYTATLPTLLSSGAQKRAFPFPICRAEETGKHSERGKVILLYQRPANRQLGNGNVRF